MKKYIGGFEWFENTSLEELIRKNKDIICCWLFEGIDDLNIRVQKGISELMERLTSYIRKRHLVGERQASRGGVFCWVIPQ